MKRIYRNIGMALLLTAAACSTDNAIEDPFIGPSEPIVDGSIAPNPYWAWVTEFPGFIPAEMPRVNAEVALLAQAPVVIATATQPLGWQSCGYYAAPGETITVTVPAGVNGLKYRIGGFNNVLESTTTTFKRFADMNSEGELLEGENKIMSYFGGHLYFFYPAGGPATSLQMAGVVKSPDFVKGVTDATSWKQEIASTIMPWAELRSDRIIITLPTGVLKGVNDPAGLLDFYDDMIANDYDGFYGVDTKSTPWRLRSDVQLSAASLSSVINGGYPAVVVKGTDTAIIRLPELKDPNVLKVFRSLSHTYQEANLGGDYFKDAFLNLPYHRLNQRKNIWSLTNSEFEGVIRDHVASVNPAKRFYDLVAGQRVAMFIQLAQQYGWNIFPYIVEQFRVNPAPTHDQDKTDALAMYASEYANQNLSSFFDAWGFAASSYAVNYMNKFPAIATPFWNNTEKTFGNFDTKTPVVFAKDACPIHTVISRKNWAVKAMRTVGGKEEKNEHVETGGKIGEVAKLIDGDLTTMWHSKWPGDEGAQYPHTIDIDMKVPTEFNYAYYRQRNTASNDNKCRRFQILIKDGAGQWTPIEDGKVFTLGLTTEEQRIYFEKSYNVQELKLKLLSPHPAVGRPYSDANLQLYAVSIVEFGLGVFK